MATIPFQNFAFTDPVAAQQAVQMGQLLTLAQAEKDRNFANYAQEGLRQQTARQNSQAARQDASQQRAIQLGQLNQQAAEAEKNRQARASEIDKDIASREKIAGMGMERTKTNALIKRKFDTVASLIESDDPPTDSEFGQLVQGLDEDSVFQLKTALDQNRNALSELANEAKQLADFWNQLGDSVKVGEDDKFKKISEAFGKDRRAGELLARDPSKPLRFLPKIKGPRMDAPAVPAVPRVTSIDELRGRILSNGGTPSRGSMMAIPSPGFVPRATDFAVPNGGPIIDEPPAGMIDPYAQPRFAVPQY